MRELSIVPAGGFIGRARGLLFRQPLAADQALLLCPCCAVHTFFMRDAIDVVFLDRQGRVIKLAEALRPWRFAYAQGAFAVLELRKWQARRHGLQIGSPQCIPVPP
jgi:uncharacterized protein